MDFLLSFIILLFFLLFVSLWARTNANINGTTANYVSSTIFKGKDNFEGFSEKKFKNLTELLRYHTTEKAIKTYLFRPPTSEPRHMNLRGTLKLVEPTEGW